MRVLFGISYICAMDSYASNYSVLPFYDSLGKQNHARKHAHGARYALWSRNSRLLPFQIRRESSLSPISTLLLHTEGCEPVDILAEATAAGLAVLQFAGYDLIVNPSALIFPTFQIRTGEYWLELSDGTDTWYSEVFTVTDDPSRLVELRFWDEEGFTYEGGGVDFTYPFKSYYLLDATLNKPEYPFEEEVTERDGYFFPEKQISKKRFRLDFLAPEYMCDVLRLLPMHDNVQVLTDKADYEAIYVEWSPDWQEQGDLAAVELFFETGTVVKKIGRAQPFAVLGDFNNDFNNDYDV